MGEQQRTTTSDGATAVFRDARCAGTWSFATQTKYAAKGMPSAIAVGDLNGDGHTDLAFANYNVAGTVSVLLNMGDGTFGTATTYAVGNSPESIAVGDLDGDGALDLVATNIDDNTISVLLNAGNGTFRAQVTYAAGNSPGSVTVGDFNQDGLPDLAVVNDDLPNNLSVFFNAGRGRFRAPVTYSETYWPSSVVAADLNRDGVLDLAYANMGQGTVNVLLNTGEGAFGACQSYFETADADTGSIAVADFNRDGYPDIVAANDFVPGGVVVLFNSGDGSFGTQVAYLTGAPVSEMGEFGGAVAVGDFNGDGQPDIAAVNNFATNVGVLLNAGDGTFGVASTYAAGYAGASFEAIAAGDFNADGVDDIATANGDYTVSVLLSQCQ